MAIRRCPYCKAIIDESQKYCNNCGTQLLFPDDDQGEEPIKGEKIVDEDFPGTGNGHDSDAFIDELKNEADIDLEALEEREEIDLEKILEGKAENGGNTAGEDQSIVDLREAEPGDRIPESFPEEPLIEKPATFEEIPGTEIEFPGRIEPDKIEVPKPARSSSRKKKQVAADKPAEEIVAPPESGEKDEKSHNTKYEIARLIAEFERRRRNYTAELGAEAADARVSDRGESGDQHPVFATGDLEEETGPKDLPPPPAEDLDQPAFPSEPGETEKPEEAAEETEFPEKPAESPAGDITISQNEARRQSEDDFPPLPTMGIPETVAPFSAPLPFDIPASEAEIEKELEAIAPPEKPVVRRLEPAAEEKAADLEPVREAREKIKEAFKGEEIRVEKPSVRAPVVRLGFFRRIKATILDLLVVGAFWAGATALAAHFLSVPILDLIIVAAVPLGILFAVLLAVYLFMFLLFLGETPGGRLVTPRN